MTGSQYSEDLLLEEPVHFIGLGGAGMSAVARVLLGRGVRVSGSDAADSRGLRALAGLGAAATVGHTAASVPRTGTVVVSTAIRATNPELEEARRIGLTVLHRSEALAAAMGGRRTVAVAGTHGKTTTTAMITVLLRNAGLNPSFAIGGDVAALGVNAEWTGGPVFVAEADESDGSFLNYDPQLAVVTNVEADHLDHYGSADAVHAVFADFADRLPDDGVLVACADDAGAAALVAGQPPTRRVRTYGYSEAADIRIGATRAVGSTSNSVLSFVVDGMDAAQELQLGVPGRHNVLNAVAAFAVALELGVDPAVAAAGLSLFSGAARRFEARGQGDGVRVFDDYAHHPTEVEAALTAARTVAGGHGVHVLFQPHLFSRTREFAAGFASALALADTVTVLPVYAAREDPVQDVGGWTITDLMPGADAAYAEDPDLAMHRVVGAARPGDVVLTIGAGDVTQYGVRLVSLLAGREVGAAPEEGGA
ncbi:UDP-N-acetylmuramate--alanine ligase [Arthrobacter sp. RIT-PI-e]|uniref:UDP-N-acetylmuramate--L-alanine ligase n=1 Tax=Arthrobacter sp. RIT-PI-e TaxID=1681197 RepID=UPI00067656AF|nr:UDP-N-acetylmuramate--L-alanine ligase [Arthrobacter sp. RIT-PI-e]KNC17677.1 UDP-N-acetylmuramate--alanine ligase [Arthrobacter sp. RIT-PI-e]